MFRGLAAPAAPALQLTAATLGAIASAVLERCTLVGNSNTVDTRDARGVAIDTGIVAVGAPLDDGSPYAVFLDTTFSNNSGAAVFVRSPGQAFASSELLIDDYSSDSTDGSFESEVAPIANMTAFVRASLLMLDSPEVSTALTVRPR